MIFSITQPEKKEQYSPGHPEKEWHNEKYRLMFYGESIMHQAFPFRLMAPKTGVFSVSILLTMASYCKNLPIMP